MYLEKENIFFVEEKKSGEGKGRKYLEKENIFSLWGKRKGVKEKGEIIWTRKINGDANQPGEPAFSKVRKQKAEICDTPNKEGAQENQSQAKI